MATSVYQQFVKVLTERWRGDLPKVTRVRETFAPAMPKSSTFYAGRNNRLGRHLFLNFQHHSKSWHVGEFTVNVILSSNLGAPAKWLTLDNELGTNSEGSHRLGMLLYGKDKWWCLRDTDNQHGIAWRPTSYADPALVIHEAVVDVTRDVRQFLDRITEAAEQGDEADEGTSLDKVDTSG
jgi:hypothetical protein